jgi:Ca2+-binding RTX toxin-like protein
MAADFEGTDGPDTEYGTYMSMRGLGGADQLGSDAGFAKIYGGAGNDGLFYYGAGNSRLYGEGGADQLAGGAQNDKFYGGGGSDWFYGGWGKNIYVTGNGRDHIVFGDIPDGDKLDKGKDFDPNKDYLNFNPFYFPVGASGDMLPKSQFRKGAKAKDEDDYFGYNKNTGIVWFDGDGSGAGVQVDIIKLDDGLGISHLNIGF